MARNIPARLKTWDLVKSYLVNPVTWKSLAYLLVKFPLGILTFVVLVALIAVTLRFLAAPVICRLLSLQIWFIGDMGIHIDTLWKAIGCSFVGLVLFYPILHIFNGLAWISGRFARVMLS